MATEKKTVAIVGAGFVGMRAFRELSGDKLISLVTIDAKDYYENTPCTIDCMVDPAYSDKVLQEYSANPALKASFKQGLVTGITSDGTTGEITLQSGEKISFDYAVLGTGSSYGGIKCAPGEATTKAERKAVFAEQHQAIADSETIVVVGGGAVGIEAASFIAEAFPGKKVTLIASGSRVLEAFDEKASDYVAKWFAGHGVTVVTSERVTDWGAVKDGPVQTTVLTDKGNSYTGMVFKCLGVKPNTAGLGSSIKLSPSGAILVEPTLQVEGTSNVFAAGDVAATPEEKTGNYADYAGLVVARNIKALIYGKPLETFPAGVIKGQEALPYLCGAMLGQKDGIIQMGIGKFAELQTGGMVAKMHYFFNKLGTASAAGSWFYSFLYRNVKNMFAGQLAGLAKKTAEAA